MSNLETANQPKTIPFMGRLFCSECGRQTRHIIDKVTRIVLKKGGRIVAFCDPCERKRGVDGDIFIVIGSNVPFEIPYINGHSDWQQRAEAVIQEVRQQEGETHVSAN